MHFHTHRQRLNLESEHRLAWKQVGGGADDLGKINFNTNPWEMDNIPRGYVDEDGNGMRERVEAKGVTGKKEEMDGPRFKRKLQTAVENVTAKFGVPGDLGAQFDEFLDIATVHVWRMPDMQYGMAKITDAFNRGWSYFWDLVQTRSNLPDNHPLFKSAMYRRGMRVPGVYDGSGKLIMMSRLALGNRSTRKLSAEMDRFDQRPRGAKRYDANVPSLYRGTVKNAASNNFGFDMSKQSDQVRFDRIQWEKTKDGNETTGAPYIFKVQVPGGAMDEGGGWVEGEQPRQGVVAVYGDPNVPGAGEVIFVDFMEANAMLDMIQVKPKMEYLVTKPGFYSEGQAAAIRQMMNLMPTSDNRISTDYANPILVRLIKDGESLMEVYSALEASGITYEDLTTWMPSATVDDDSGPKLVAFWKAVKPKLQADRTTWKRAFSTIFHQIKANPDPSGASDWFDQLVDKMESL